MTTFHSGENPAKTLDGQHYVNPIRQALWYKQLLDEGRFNTQAELAQGLGVSRSRVASILRLLNLASEIQALMIDMAETDCRLEMLTERRLRSVVQNDDADEQLDRFREMIESVDALSGSMAS